MFVIMRQTELLRFGVKIIHVAARLLGKNDFILIIVAIAVY